MKDHDKLSGQYVSPREFIEKCPPRYIDLDSPCFGAADWLSEHPKVAARLKASGKAVVTSNLHKTLEDDLLVPKGGDRLTEKLYDFANSVGRENVTAKGFKDWLRKNNHKSEFDVTHGSISFRYGTGKFAEVTDNQLGVRIYRLRHPK